MTVLKGEKDLYIEVLVLFADFVATMMNGFCHGNVNRYFYYIAKELSSKLCITTLKLHRNAIRNKIAHDHCRSCRRECDHSR